jgi:hypothetical protein
MQWRFVINFLGFPQADLSSHDPLFAINSGIPRQLCETTDIYNLDVIPFFGCYQSGILSHETRSNPTCEYSKA